MTCHCFAGTASRHHPGKRTDKSKDWLAVILLCVSVSLCLPCLPASLPVHACVDVYILHAPKHKDLNEHIHVSTREPEPTRTATNILCIRSQLCLASRGKSAYHMATTASLQIGSKNPASSALCSSWHSECLRCKGASYDCKRPQEE